MDFILKDIPKLLIFLNVIPSMVDKILDRLVLENACGTFRDEMP